MPKQKRRPGIDATTVVMEFANMVDALFLRYTGRTVQELLREPAQRPELPPAEPPSPINPMPLADAYAVLGLKPGAPPDQIKKHYRNLAKFFHSDSGNVMNDEAMKLINRAHDTLTKQDRYGL